MLKILEIAELQKDKASLTEKLFEETKKLQQELFAKGAASKSKVIPIILNDLLNLQKEESSVDFVREKAHLEEQHQIELVQAEQ